VAEIAPAAGRILWDAKSPKDGGVTAIASPVLNGSRLFVSGFFDGALMLRLEQEDPTAQIARNDEELICASLEGE